MSEQAIGAPAPERVLVLYNLQRQFHDETTGELIAVSLPAGTVPPVHRYVWAPERGPCFQVTWNGKPLNVSAADVQWVP